MKNLAMMVKYQTVTWILKIIRLVKKTWDKFKMKNMGDYHDNYLKKDALLSADVFKMFISTCLKYYGLDPCH